jgi:cell division protein FtsB
MAEKKRLDQEPLVADIALKQDRMLGQIGMIVDQVSLHTVRLDDLTRRVTSTEKKIDTLASGAANVTISLSETRQEMQQRFDELKKGQTKLEKRMEEFEQTQGLILMLLKEHLK